MEPLISVIVPVYNLENYIVRTLESICRQTYRNLEIIVVDDGSADGSWKVITDAAAEDARIRPIQQENAGVTAARLKGVSAAAGDWIGFVDGDDEIQPEMYERLLRNALQQDAQISHCGYQMVFADGRVHYFYNTGLLAKHDKITALRELLSGQMVEPGLCNKLFQKNLLQSLLHRQCMPKDIKINEDLLMNFYLFSEAETAVFDDWCPYHYIIRQTSATRAKLNDNRVYDPVRVKERILDELPSELREDGQRALMNTCVYSYCSLMLEKDYPTREAERFLRKKLQEHKAWCRELPGRTRLLAMLILYAPGVLKMVYPFYANHLQKSKYD